MIYVQLIFAFIIIFLAGRILLGLRIFGINREPAEVRFPLYFFAGTSLIGLYMLILSLLNFRYSVASIAFPIILLSIPALRSIRDIQPPALKLPRFNLSIELISFLCLGLICAAMLIDGFVSPVFSKDAFAMWFFKAKMIFMEKRIPFEVFRQPYYAYSSPEYPLLAPLNLAWISLCLGLWNDILLRMFFIVQYMLFIPFFYSSLKRYTNRNMAALGCLLLMANRHVLVYAANGYLDLMVGMFTAISAIYLIKWMNEKDKGHLLLSAFFIGCAAFTKYEGIALFLAMAVTLALFLLANKGKAGFRGSIAGFSAFIALAALVFGPGQLASLVHHMSSHMIKNANIIATTIANTGRIPQIAGHFFFQLYLNTFSWQYFWIFITIFLIVGWRRIFGTNMKYLLLFLLISLAIYFEVYILTVANNLESSFHRLLIGLAPSFVYLVISSAPKDDVQQ